MANREYSPEEYLKLLELKTEKRKNFTNMFMKFTALLLGCSMVFSSTIIAYNKINANNQTVLVNGENITESDINSGQNSTGNNEDTSEHSGENQDSNSQTNSQNSSTGQSDSSSIKKPTNGTTDETANGASGTSDDKFDEQYRYFLKSFNDVKKNAKSVENYRKKGTNYKNIADAGSFSKLLSALMNAFLKEEEPTDAIYKGEDIKKNFPPAGEICHLKKSDIKSIKVTETDKYYIYKITCKNEMNPKAGYGSGSIASLITREQIMGPIKNVPGLKSLDPSCAYENVSCEAKIEKSTGRMVEYTFDMPLILSFEKQNFHIGLEFFEWWKITY